MFYVNHKTIVTIVNHTYVTCNLSMFLIPQIQKLESIILINNAL